RGLRVGGQDELFLGALAHDSRQVLPERLVDFLEHLPRHGAGIGQLGPHADLVAALPGKHECGHHRLLFSPRGYERSGNRARPKGTILLAASWPMSAEPRKGMPERAHQSRAMSRAVAPNGRSFSGTALTRPSRSPAIRRRCWVTWKNSRSTA